MRAAATRCVSIYESVDVAIVGAGVVGLATALAVQRAFPDCSLAVLEKEAVVAAHQSGHNSGVIHSGIYYKPGSLKAKLCTEGRESLLRFCDEHALEYVLCGKVIVATKDSELPGLEELYARGVRNGLQGLQRLSSQEIKEFEPHAAGLRGIRVPGTGIVDYGNVAHKYAELIRQQGGTIYLSHEITALQRRGGTTLIETKQGSVGAKVVINCAGLQSDRVSKLTGARLDLAIVPFRGEYYELVEAKRRLIQGLLYPVPDPKFPFLGVHFTRRVGGGVEAGPNAVLALKREGYSRTSFAVGDVLDYASFPGFWIMAARHWRMSIGEYHRSWSKSAFVRALQSLVPEICAEDLVPGGSGVRAQALDSQGKLIDDFRFAYTDGVVHVCNVPSPAATASLAIGRYIVETMVQHHGLELGRRRY